MTGENVDANGDLTEVWATAIASLSDGSLTPQQRAFVALTRPMGLVEDTALIEQARNAAEPGSPS